MANAEKVERLKGFTELIKDKSMVFFEYHGINVDDLNEIRTNLRNDGSVVKVIKNTMAMKALGDLNIKFDESVFRGMIATGVIETDRFIDSSKSILKAEKAEKITIKGGYFEGAELDSDGVRKYASLPNKEELYGSFVGCLQSIIANLVYVLDDIKGEKEKGAPTPVAEEAKEEKFEQPELEKVENGSGEENAPAAEEVKQEESKEAVEEKKEENP